MKKIHGKCRLHRIHRSQTQAGWCDFAKPPLHCCTPLVGKPRGWRRRKVTAAVKIVTPACRLSLPRSDWVDRKLRYECPFFSLSFFYIQKLWVGTWARSCQGQVLLCNQCEPCPLSNCLHSESQGVVHWWRERCCPRGDWRLHPLVTPHAKQNTGRTNTFSATGNVN